MNIINAITLIKFNFSNSIWSIFGALINKGLNFIAFLIVAKNLGPQLFGEYNVIQSTIGLFGTISGLGLGLAATKLVAEWKSKDKKYLGELVGALYLFSALISFFVFTTLYTSSGWVANELLKNSSMTVLLKITSVIIILDSISGIQNGILLGLEGFKKLALINLVSGIIGAALLVSGAFYYGIQGLTLGLLLSRIIFVVTSYKYIRDLFFDLKIDIRIVFSLKILKPIFSISLPSFLSSMVTNPIGWIVTTIFVNQPEGYSNLGIFNAANQLRQLVLFLPDSAGKSSIPQLASAYGNGEMKKFQIILKKTILMNFIFSICPAIFLHFYGDIFMSLIGKKYSIDNNLTDSILMIGVVVAITNAIGYIFICSSKVWFDFLLRVVWGAAWLIIVFIYGKYNGPIGYSQSVLLSFVTLLVFQVLVLIKFNKDVTSNFIK